MILPAADGTVSAFRALMGKLAILGLVIASAALGCGAIRSASSTDGPPTDESGQDGGNGGAEADGSSVGTAVDGSLPGVDAGPPNAQCPAHYSVYGNADANLGAVNPTLIAAGTCTATTEQYADGGFGPTDFTMTFMQSSQRSGMFMATLHQTTPFPYDLTVCLEPDGPNTGSKPTMPGGNDGTMILTNVPEDAKPWTQYPKVTYDTNFQPSRQYGDFMDVAIDAQQRISLGKVTCTFTDN